MKFDSNSAWKEASAAISANRDVVFALAGVFYLLPSLAIALLFPSPEPVASMDQKALMAQASEYYASIMPVALPLLVFQAAGTLALLTLLTDRSRPTVREALGIGLRGVIAYCLAQLILGLGLGLVGGLLLTVGAATGVAVIAAISVVAVVILVAYAMIKTSLAAPVISVEGERNPLAALRRSWTLTRGNSVRIGLFYLLVGLAFIVITLVLTSLAGIVVALLASADASQIAGAVMSSAVNAVMVIYFVAIIAATHRQLVAD